MKHLPKNTLAYFNAAPQTHLHDLSDLPTAVFSASSKEYKKHADKPQPSDLAVTFYTLNHCAGIIRKAFTPNEPLPEWARSIMQSYTDTCMAQGERMLHYILLITTREMRHLHGSSPAFWAKLKKEFDQKGVDILKHISSDGSEDSAMNKYLAGPDMTIGHYLKALSFGFHQAGQPGQEAPSIGHGGWSGGYGGPPWGNVTDAAISMLSGDTSMEMLVDTGYTLAHNGGPIYNKNFIYTPQDSSFLTVLDIQRGGQMLELMLDAKTYLHVKKTPEAVQAAELIKTHAPEEVKGWIDWKLIDDQRPAKEKQEHPAKYSTLTGAQAQPTAKPKPKKVVPPKPTVVLLHGKPVKVIGTYQVYPHQTVSVVEREKV